MRRVPAYWAGFFLTLSLPLFAYAFSLLMSGHVDDTVAPPSADFAVVQSAGRTTAGDQDFTVANYGTPDAYLLSITRGVTNGTVAAHAVLGVGAGDGTSQWAGGVYSEDNSANAQVGRTVDTVSSLVMPGLNNTVDGTATFSAFITDGVRLNYAGNPLDDAYLVHMALLRGENITVGTATHDGAEDVSQTFTVGHTVDVVFIFSVGQPFSGVEQEVNQFSFGVAVNGGNQWCGHTAAKDNTANTSVVGWVHTSRVHIIAGVDTGSILRSGEVTSFPANAFAITKRDGAADLNFGYIAIDLPAGVSASAFVHDTPIVTGQQVVTTPGFRPQFLLMMPLLYDAVNVAHIAGATGSGAFGFAFVSAAAQYYHGMSDEDGASADSNTQSLATNQLALVYDGAGVQAFDVDFDAFTATGWNMTFNTSVPGTARKWPILAISE